MKALKPSDTDYAATMRAAIDAYGTLPTPDPRATFPYWVTFTTDDEPATVIDCVLNARNARHAERLATDLVPDAATITVERMT